MQSGAANAEAERTSVITIHTFDEDQVVAVQAFPSVRTQRSPAQILPLSNVLTNTAALSADLASTQHPMTVLQYTARGTSSEAETSGLSCHSTLAAALAVDRAPNPSLDPPAS